MQNVVIYLIGFPGVGKYTIAKEIAQKTDFKIVDNHLINNPIFSIIDRDQKIPPQVWNIIGRVWDLVMETIIDISPQHYNFILTNVLLESNENDKIWFSRVENMTRQRKAIFVPVRLHCAVDVHQNRIALPERAERMKLTDIHAPKRLSENEKVLATDNPNVLDLDTSEISASEAADKILAHAQKIYEATVPRR